MSESGLGQRYAKISILHPQVATTTFLVSMPSGATSKRPKRAGANVVGVEPVSILPSTPEEEGIEVLKEEFDPGRFHQPST